MNLWPLTSWILRKINFAMEKSFHNLQLNVNERESLDKFNGAPTLRNVSSASFLQEEVVLVLVELWNCHVTAVIAAARPRQGIIARRRGWRRWVGGQIGASAGWLARGVPRESRRVFASSLKVRLMVPLRKSDKARKVVLLYIKIWASSSLAVILSILLCSSSIMVTSKYHFLLLSRALSIIFIRHLIDDPSWFSENDKQ